MSPQTSTIIGNWERLDHTACSDIYPDSVLFREDGLYFARKDPAGSFSLWDVGTFEIVGSGEMKISLANDAVAKYGFSLSGDLLTFTDETGCTFTFRRTS